MGHEEDHETQNGGVHPKLRDTRRIALVALAGTAFLALTISIWPGAVDRIRQVLESPAVAGAGISIVLAGTAILMEVFLRRQSKEIRSIEAQHEARRARRALIPDPLPIDAGPDTQKVRARTLAQQAWTEARTRLSDGLSRAMERSRRFELYASLSLTAGVLIAIGGLWVPLKLTAHDAPLAADALSVPELWWWQLARAALLMLAIEGLAWFLLRQFRQLMADANAANEVASMRQSQIAVLELYAGQVAPDTIDGMKTMMEGGTEASPPAAVASDAAPPIRDMLELMLKHLPKPAGGG